MRGGTQVELLSVFHILVEMISSPVHLQEECDLLAINLIVKSQDRSPCRTGPFEQLNNAEDTVQSLCLFCILYRVYSIVYIYMNLACGSFSVKSCSAQNIDLEKFKPVMLAALRSLLPKQWSTKHETAWEWLWMTVARNLNDPWRNCKRF